MSKRPTRTAGWLAACLWLAASASACSCDSAAARADAGADRDADGAAGADGADGIDAGADGADGTDGADAGGDAPDCREQIFEDLSIPMRDGKSLAAFVRRASGSGCRQPVVLLQTPYGKENARALWFADAQAEPLFASTDYAFVVVDWRGFFGSQAAAVAEPAYGQDGYDTVEWIAAQDWCDGTVGTWGVSALGVQQHRTAVQQPPHLAAAVPIFCQMNISYGQYYPGGVLRQEYFDFISTYFGGGDIFLQHPYRDLLWQVTEQIFDPADVAVPMLVVAGWYDLYNTGTLADFRALQQESAAGVRAEQRLLVGPWIHFAAGGETSGAGRPLDEQELSYFDSERRIQRDSLAFFDRHLRGQPSEADSWPPVRWLTGGAGGWEQGERWPPIGAGRAVFYPETGGFLARGIPLESKLSFPYDPDDPSPTVGGATLLPSLAHGPRFQDEVIARGDALVFETERLGEMLRLRDAVQAFLDVSTDAPDTDLAVRLTDVGPDNRHLLVAEGIGRLKLRDDLSAPAEVQPGQIYSLSISTTNELAYDFAAGHRVGLIVSSSNYPRFARNPNTGDDFYEDAASPRAVTNYLHLGPGTRLVLPAGQ